MAGMYCANHPQLEAVWLCTRCQRLACGDCVKRIGARRTQVGACLACGGLLKEVSAKPVLTGADDFLDLVRRPFTVDGFLTALGCAIPAAIPFLPLRSWISGA